MIRVVSALFPFKPTLDALDAALNDAGGLAGAAAAPAPLLVSSALRRARRALAPPGAVSLDWTPMAFPATRTAPAAQDRRAARPRARDRAHGPRTWSADVRPARRGPRTPGRGDARRRAAVDLARRRGGRRGARARHPRGAALRRARREGRAGLGRLRRRGRRAARGARDQGRASRARRDHRRLPVRLHSHGHCGVVREDGDDRQRRHARAARARPPISHAARARTPWRRAT